MEYIPLFSLCISGIMAIVSIIGMMKTRRKDNDESVRKSMENEIRMKSFGEMLESINSSMTKLLEGFTSNEKRISLLERSIKDAFREINELKEEIKEYHR